YRGLAQQLHTISLEGIVTVESLENAGIPLERISKDRVILKRKHRYLGAQLLGHFRDYGLPVAVPATVSYAILGEFLDLSTSELFNSIEKLLQQRLPVLSEGKVRPAYVRNVWEQSPAREILEFTDALRMCKYIAYTFARKCRGMVDRDDILSEAMYGLAEAHKRYDPSKGSFVSFASSRVRGAILDYLRHQDTCSRSTRRRLKTIAKVEAVLGAAGPYSREKLLAVVGLTEEQLLEARQSQNFYRKASDEEIENATKTLSDPKLDPLREYAGLEMRAALEARLSALTERQQDVLRMYYFEDRNMRDIGEQLGITESRVSQLHSAALSRLQDNLKDEAGEMLGALSL
ncbi:MAG TPA: sigma-70 family RNA polymerase sigma factor, partial [Candidatus Nanoarchaeia archaeon]|nr:sigma-70 family RNA polymerase sigma factor [Candidatus Nanoarchaeia archaeon]